MTKKNIFEIYLNVYNIFFFFTYIILPIKTPKANNRMKGLLLPYFNLHLSLKLPKIGVTKKPIRGLSAQTRVIC